MSKFDTHGGFFAPKGFLRVNTGGSHSENPNGGVHLGVDENGVPNLLEEGEPVYEDFVFSDNIRADKSILKKMNLPEKYAGKLYSEIADDYLEEAEVRPNDPISSNGLDAMLSRLAAAQEEQKQRRDERRLKAALDDLTPEELDELGQMLASDEIIQEPMPTVEPDQVQIPESPDMQQPMLEQQQMVGFKNGGKMNKYAGGGWTDFINALNAYRVSRNPGNVEGTYRIDRSFPLAGYNTIRDLENSDAYRNFTNYVLANPNDPNVQNYLRALDEGTAAGVPKLFNGNTLVDNWADIYNYRRNDQKGGIYHFSGNNINDLNFLAGSQNATPVANRAAQWGPMLVAVNAPTTKAVMQNTTEKSHTGPTQYTGSAAPMYATLPRYAGAIGSGLLALNTALQDPDHYEVERVRPNYVAGNINLQNQRYVPFDWNIIASQLGSQAAAQRRQLANSGLGPSTAAAQLAAGNNANMALGNGFLQAWQANNQQRNNVIAHNNQAEAQRAMFDFRRDATNTQIGNQYGQYNAERDLMLQQLNNRAEQDKYTALSQNLSNALQGLSNIGRENFIRNQINSNNALYWYTDPSGRNVYRGSCGGFLKKYKK